MKALLQYRASPGLLRRIAEAVPGWIEVVVVDEDDHSRFDAEIVDTDVLWHVLEPVTAEVFDRARRLRLVQKIGVGVNTIDLDAAGAHGCAVANMPGTNTQAVAEMTLALLLAALRRLPAVDRAVRAGDGWTLPAGVVDGFAELAGRSVGLVGFGAVASRLAPVLQALGAEVSYTATSAKPDVALRYLTLDDLLSGSDVVSLHLPLSPSTESLIDAEAISRMRPGAVLVNTARGGLVDEVALFEALSDGRLSAAGLDVFRDEPVDPANPLLTLDNVVVAPHVAWLTGGTLDASIVVAVENCRRLRDGEALLHEVVPGG